MAIFAPVNKIIPMSVVDGPGNRTAIFLQACNIACAYCHNPETQTLCTSCGICVEKCPAGALRIDGGKVVWDHGTCCSCDTCISVCPNNSSPKIRMMSTEDVIEMVKKNIPFIRGITVSGGECTLYPGFLTELFSKAKALGLGTLIDSNGTMDLSIHPELLDVTDGVMLDVKSWKEDVFRALTGKGNATVLKNLRFLAVNGKLEEIRIVCLEGEVDVEDDIRGIAQTIPEYIPEVPLKLIRFRSNGVRGRLSNASSPSSEQMAAWKETAVNAGFTRIQIR